MAIDYDNNLKALRADLRVFIEEHSKQAQIHSYIYNGIMYTSIVTSLAIGFVLSITASQGSTAIKYITGILSFINSILVAIIKFKNFEEISLAHRKATKEYLGLYKSIINELLTKKEDIKTFTDWAFRKYDTIFTEAPFVIDKKMYDDHILESATNLHNLAAQQESNIGDMMQFELRRMQSNIQNEA